MTTTTLPKSKLLAFRQCPRRLYLQVHEPSVAEPSTGSDARLMEGQRVGEVARSFYPEGVLILGDRFSQALSATQSCLTDSRRRVLFEPAFEHKDVAVRADVLVPAGRHYDLVEVKSATRLKDHYPADVAIQASVLTGAGLKLRHLTLSHINRDFVYPGGGCYHEKRRNGRVNSLFTECDVTDSANTLVPEVARWAHAARRTLSGKMPPRTDACHDPVECEFQGYCYPQETKYPIEWLPRIRAETLDALHRRGYRDIRDIPEGVLKTPIQEWVRAVTVKRRADLRPGAREVIAALPYPRYYLDFETIQFAVPIWKGTSPYHQVPFQWSCHIEKDRRTIRHEAFLDLSGEDPSRAFAQALIAATGKKGPILVYNRGFEAGIVRALANRYRDLTVPLKAIESRLVDLLPITRKHYYHPAMGGSWSIKAVLPTIGAGLDYADLEEVQDGGGAQAAYLEAIAPDTTRGRKAALKKALTEYCKLDTWGMVALARFLESAKR